VVPAANENALPRYNRSYEYDSITPTYSEFLIDEFLPAIESKHDIKLSTDPNHTAISGNSSGGICAFMVAWHRPDRFRRVFTGVGTYVGIHGADQLPVLVRKFEPKPLRVFLQSGTGDNNLYCGDWWMANQMMERSLTWAGYDVNHAWGEGGHNQKHASQIFPEVLRWLWRDWQTTMEVKANPRGDSKWKGYEVVESGSEWIKVYENPKPTGLLLDDDELKKLKHVDLNQICSDDSGRIYSGDHISQHLLTIDGVAEKISLPESVYAFTPIVGGARQIMLDQQGARTLGNAPDLKQPLLIDHAECYSDIAFSSRGRVYACKGRTLNTFEMKDGEPKVWTLTDPYSGPHDCQSLALSPDQSQLYVADRQSGGIWLIQLDDKGLFQHEQLFGRVDGWAGGLCVDQEGRLYVANTVRGIEVLDQAGRVNFIIPTPTRKREPSSGIQDLYDVCFGGKDLSELFIACGDTIYKRATKAKGVVSGQQAPIKPPAPKL
jgi:predicted esterase